MFMAGKQGLGPSVVLGSGGECGKGGCGRRFRHRVEVCQSTTRPGHTGSAVIPWSWVDRTLKEHVVPCIYILIFILTDILIRYHYSNFPFYSFMPSRQVIKSCIWFMVPRQCSISKYCLTKAALYDPVCLG